MSSRVLPFSHHAFKTLTKKLRLSILWVILRIFAKQVKTPVGDSFLDKVKKKALYYIVSG